MSKRNTFVSHSDSSLTKLIKTEFSNSQPFVELSYNILVSTTPYQAIGNENSIKDSVIAALANSSNELPPHIYTFGLQAYQRMLYLEEDQAFITFGESGSGKTFNSKMFTDILLELSKQKHKEKRIHSQVHAAQIILEAFTQIETPENSEASTATAVTQLLFNKRGSLVGSNKIPYLWRKSGLTDSGNVQEGNFHILYTLLAGMSTSMKKEYELVDNPSMYTFLRSKSSLSKPRLAPRYIDLTSAFKELGINKKIEGQIFSILAVVLHLSTIEFQLSPSQHNDEPCAVKNHNALHKAAKLLGIDQKHLEAALVYKSKKVNGDIFTVLLEPDEAIEQRDSLARMLYNAAFRAVIEFVNHRTYKEDYDSVISIFDLPGRIDKEKNTFESFLNNFSQDVLYKYVCSRQISRVDIEPTKMKEVVEQLDDVIELYTKPVHGLFVLLNELSQEYINNTTSSFGERLVESFNRHHGSSQSRSPHYLPSKSRKSSFVIIHYGNYHSTYGVQDFVPSNMDVIHPDFVTLFIGGGETPASGNNFIKEIIERNHTITYKDDHVRIHSVQPIFPPARDFCIGNNKKETYKSKKITECPSKDINSTSTHYWNSLHQLTEFFDSIHFWTVFCLLPNSSYSSNEPETKVIKSQVKAFALSSMNAEWCLTRSKDDFMSTYQAIIKTLSINLQEDSTKNIISIMEAINPDFDISKDYQIVSEDVFLASSAFVFLEKKLFEELKKAKKQERKLEGKGMGGGMDGQSVTESQVSEESYDETESLYDPRTYTPVVGNSSQTLVDISGTLERTELDNEKKATKEEIVELSKQRRNWLRYVKCTTFWIPEACIKRSMERPDVRLAWREKVALWITILMLSAVMLFYILGLGKVLCPKQNVFAMNEISWRQTFEDSPMVALYGGVYDITDFAQTHMKASGISRDQLFEFVGGMDVRYLFPFPLTDCALTDEDKTAMGSVTLTVFNQSLLLPYHQHTDPAGDLVIMHKDYYAGDLVWDMAYLQKAVQNQYAYYLMYNDEIFDLSDYINTDIDDKVSNILFPGELGTSFRKKPTQLDWTPFITNKMNDDDRANALACLRHLFPAGKIDTRHGIACQFSEYMLLSASVIMTSVIVVKFLAALQLGSRRIPESYDKFVVIQVPCYTEGEESLRRTIDSVATMEYDDKRKLLFIIADGMIIGSGNDKPTPRIVLDILGVDPNLNPDPVAYHALGEGNRQLNMAKVYSGLYEVEGHLVPYLVVVKCGRETERSRPGNRGKRDSQLILMKFLSKVHYDAPMSPVELEIFHQLKNVIGVDPSFYEYLLMVDADTEVFPDSLTRLIAACLHDKRIMGLCGETLLVNDNQSWVTMIQVYEYYISHHLSKAFESLFGTVTCLPGCFCMYRIRTPDNNIPLIVSKSIVADYAENNIDTLHKKNLLALGEDRYLTTLMLKHFPQRKLVFTADSKCKTAAPDRWVVLLSQRRRWINSTVHNLFELLFLNQLCGFCLFSMRFVIFLDLFGTLVQPATVCYLVYLIILVTTTSQDPKQGGTQIPTISLLMLAATYGLQAVIFILKRRWEHIGWMIIYILGIPLFSFFIPLYSFWHFDDFSWGTTRVVIGDGGKQKVVYADGDGDFKEADIPTVRWSEYQKESAIEKNAPGLVTSSSEEGGSVYGGYGGQMRYEDSRSVAGGVIDRRNSGFSYDGMGHYTGDAIGMEYPNQQGYVNQGIEVGFPSEEQVAYEIHRILSYSDLATVTKKQIRDGLNAKFGMDLTPMKEFIHQVIHEYLESRLG